MLVKRRRFSLLRLYRFFHIITLKKTFGDIKEPDKYLLLDRSVDKLGLPDFLEGQEDLFLLSLFRKNKNEFIVQQFVLSCQIYTGRKAKSVRLSSSALVGIHIIG